MFKRRRRDYIRELIVVGNHVAYKLEKSKSSSDSKPNDDTINSVVTSWRNAARDATPHGTP